jgi:pimeloyl-ACP methyl ester carboxylesterase
MRLPGSRASGQRGRQGHRGGLNALPQFHAAIDELGVHYLHIRSPHPHARPLIMTHGWPGSVLEFLNVIGPLTDPPAHGEAATDAFQLVLPAPKDVFGTSERWLRHRFTDLRYYHQVERGGHPAAFEQLEIFVREVRDGLRALH